MAGDWIKMRLDLQDDPAVFRLSGMLKIDRYSVVGRLHSFWSWADKHAVDGRVDGASTQLVDEVVTLVGFADALLVVGWLALDDRGLSIPHYERHNGAGAKQRGMKNQRQARWRGRGASVDGGVDASTSTNASTREEKRRYTPIVPEAFDEFWKAYPGPRKVNRAKCLNVWTSKNLTPSAAAIHSHIAAMRDSPQWREAGGKFIPAPLTYLNQQRWEDGAPEAAPRRVAL